MRALSARALPWHYRSLDLGARRQGLEVMTCLQRQPGCSVASEVLRQAGSGVRGDATAFIDDLVDARRRHSQRRGQCVHAQTQGHKVIFAQHLARMHGAQTVHGTGGSTVHASHLVVVNNFDIQWPRCGPRKAHPPLVVDADAVLACAVPPERLQTISRRCTQEVQCARRVQLRELALGHMGNRAKTPGRTTLEQGLCVLAMERLDHRVHFITPNVILQGCCLHRMTGGAARLAGPGAEPRGRPRGPLTR